MLFFLSKRLPRIILLLIFSLLALATPVFADDFLSVSKCESMGQAAERGVFTKNLSDICIGCGECTRCDMLMVAKNIVGFIFQIAGPLAVLAIIVAGFLYITAGGSEERTKTAKEAIFAAIVGILIILIAWVLINFVIHILTGGTNNIFNKNWWQYTCP